MVPARTMRNKKPVPYYTCLSAQKRGWKGCPSKALPARLIEDTVMDQLIQAGVREHCTEGVAVHDLIEKIIYDGSTREVVIRLQRRSGDSIGGEARILTHALPSKPSSHTFEENLGRLPRITRMMALAIKFEELLRAGTLRDYADLARLGHVSRARVTQIMNLLHLAPDIQEKLLFLSPVKTWREPITERQIRPLIRERQWSRQREILSKLFPSIDALPPI